MNSPRPPRYATLITLTESAHKSLAYLRGLPGGFNLSGAVSTWIVALAEERAEARVNRKYGKPRKQPKKTEGREMKV